MRATKYINSKGFPKGAFIYNIKKDGTRYAKPTFIEFSSFEKTAQDVVERMRKLNPNSKFEAAENQDLLLMND